MTFSFSRSAFRRLALALATVAMTTAFVPTAEATQGRKGKMAAGIAIGALAVGAAAALAASQNRAHAQTYDYGYQPMPSPTYAPMGFAPSYAPSYDDYEPVEYRSYHRPRAVRADAAINACHRAGRKLYGYRHGRLDQVTSVERVGHGMFRVEAVGRGFEGPYASRVVCVSDSRGNVRDFAVY